MLPKAEKLNALDLKKLRKAGKRIHTTLFSVSYLSQDVTKMAVSVPKKVYKKAIDRNRAKRRVFAALEKLKNVKNKGYFEFMVKMDINNLPFETLQADMKKVLWQK